MPSLYAIVGQGYYRKSDIELMLFLHLARCIVPATHLRFGCVQILGDP